MDFITSVKQKFEENIGNTLLTADLLALAEKADQRCYNYEITPAEEYEVAGKYLSDLHMALEVLSSSNDTVETLKRMIQNGQNVIISEEDLDDYIEKMFKERYGVDMGDVHSMFQLDHSCAYGQFTETEIQDTPYYIPHKGIAISA